MAERTNAAVLKTAEGGDVLRGFESPSLRLSAAKWDFESLLIGCAASAQNRSGLPRTGSD